MARWYWYDKDGDQIVSPSHPPHSRPIPAAVEWLYPDLISDLHHSFAHWTTAELSTGPVVPHRLWIDRTGLIAVRFSADAPAPQPTVGAGEALAQWLVLMAKWMETYVVLARARSVWSLAELAAAFAVYFALPAAPHACPTPAEQLGRGGAGFGRNRN